MFDLQNHFGLKAHPFRMVPDPDYLFLSDVHRMAVTALKSTVSSGISAILLVGDEGTGKSTLLEHFHASGDFEATMAFVWEPALLERGFPASILSALGLDSAERTKDADLLQRHLGTQANLGKDTVLFVDEAQTLSGHTLEQLLNLAQRTDALTVVLAGQTELQDKVREIESIAALPSIALPNLSLPQMTAYIRHRLKQAGSEQAVFKDAALDRIFATTKGNPGAVNDICERCLRLAAEKSSKFVTAKLVVEASMLEAAQRDKHRTSRVDTSVIPAPRVGPERGPQTRVSLSATEEKKLFRRRDGFVISAVLTASLVVGVVVLLTLKDLIGFGADQAPKIPLEALEKLSQELPKDAQERFRYAVLLEETEPDLAIVAYSHAALLDHPRAALYLGQIFEVGAGVPVDVVLAKAWYELASAELSIAKASLASLPSSAEGQISAPQPLMGRVVSDGFAELSWTSGEGADPARYEVEFSSETSAVPDRAISLTLSAVRTEVPSGAAKWRVTAVDGTGTNRQASPWRPLLRE